MYCVYMINRKHDIRSGFYKKKFTGSLRFCEQIMQKTLAKQLFVFLFFVFISEVTYACHRVSPYCSSSSRSFLLCCPSARRSNRHGLRRQQEEGRAEEGSRRRQEGSQGPHRLLFILRTEESCHRRAQSLRSHLHGCPRIPPALQRYPCEPPFLSQHLRFNTSTNNSPLTLLNISLSCCFLANHQRSDSLNFLCCR
jgi:hypothetical protein